MHSNRPNFIHLTFLLVVAHLAQTGLAFGQATEPPSDTDETAASAPSDKRRAPFPIDQENPEKSVPPLAEREAYPLQFAMFMMAVSVAADEALASKDYEAAVRFYRALAKGSDDQAPAFSKLCQSYEGLGQWDSALQACRAALSRRGVVIGDYVRTLRLTLADQSRPISDTEIADLDAIIEHLKSAKAAAEVVDFFPCDLAVRLGDGKRLTACVEALRANYSDNSRVLPYEWAFALERGDFARAEEVLQDMGERSQVGEEELGRMRAAAELALSKRAAKRNQLLLWIGSGVLGLGVLGSVIAVLRRRQRGAVHA